MSSWHSIITSTYRSGAGRSPRRDNPRGVCTTERPVRLQSRLRIMAILSESERISKTGCKLHTLTALPDGTAPPKAALVFHHGIAEHINRYKPVFSQLADAGVAVYSADAIGHGTSEGERGVVMRFDDLVDDMEALADAARKDVAERYPSVPQLPFFVGGHSLGGLVAATLCIRDQTRWAGLVVLSPAMDMEWTLVLRIQAAVGGLLATLVPRARIVPAVRPEDMNCDPQRVKEYVADPLNQQGNLVARTANESLRAMRRLRARWHDFQLPVYAHHGGRDKCTAMPATRAFVEAVDSKDKVFHLIEGGYHEVMFEPNAQQTVAQLAAWIVQHAGQAPRL